MELTEREEPTWVPILVVLATQHTQLHEHGGMPGVRDRNALESALARPQNRLAYDSSADLGDLAACYAFGIATSHPFNDGNKRTAYVTAAIFLDLNGWELTHTDDEIVHTILALANHEIDESGLADWFRRAMVPRGGSGASEPAMEGRPA